MAQSVRRIARVALPLLALAFVLPACWNASRLDRLFGAPGGSGGDGGFDPGIGGGLTLRDLFAGARLLRDKPTVLRVAPVDKQKDVSIKSPIVIEFSESMFESAVRSGVSLFQSGSTTATTTALTMFQGDSVAVIIPQTDLLPNTQYEIVIAGSVTDLQGDAIDVGTSGSSDLRFTFTTIAATGDPDFDVIFSSPGQQAAEVPRASEVVILLSEPVNVGNTGGGINAPGNVVVTRNGATLAVGVDYTLATFPSANPRGIEIVFTIVAAADTEVGIGLDADVQSADGQEALNKGNGVDLDFTVQNTAIPQDALFPQSVPPAGFDGAVSTVHLHDFATDVDLTDDGQVPDSTTLIFFDKQQQNALLFNVAAADPTSFVTDLEPKAPPALLDGDVLVAAFVERRGFRSEVSVFETITKDTVGPALLGMGPPAIGNALLVTQVNDPVLHGFMSEPCAGIQVDFDGLNVPDFNSVEFSLGQATVTNDFFVTGPSEDALLPDQFEPTTAFSVIAADVLGNSVVSVGSVGHQTAGKVGALVAAPDGTTALYVSAFFSDTFFPVAFGGAVLLDSFPPDATGANQIGRGIAAGGGVVRFTDADLLQVAPNPGDKVTVTIVAQRGPSGSVVIFGPVTFAGLDPPSAASPRAILARLDPDPFIDLTSPVQCEILNESANNPTESGSAFTLDDIPSTPELERFAPFVPNPSTTDNKIDLPINQLHAFAVAERFNFGGVQQRFTSSEPFTSEDDGSGGGFGRAKLRIADFGNRPSYSALTNPNLLHSVTFDDAAVSNGGALGLVGTENPAEQFRQLRLLCRVPGFVDTVGLAAAVAFTNLGGTTRSGSVLLPQNFLDNDTPGPGTSEDSPLELLLQPDLIAPASTVDPARLTRNLRLELFIQDKLVTGTTTDSSAYTRERFIFTDPTVATTDLASLQAIPVVTPVVTTHPPQFSWPEVTQGEGMHRLTLVSALKAQTWRIYVPAQSGGGTITMQLPNLAPTGGLPDGVTGVDFSSPGLFKVFVEAFDFDPGLIFSPGSAVQYTFDPQSWFQSDLERECLRSSRSDTNVTVLTN